MKRSGPGKNLQKKDMQRTSSLVKSTFIFLVCMLWATCIQGQLKFSEAEIVVQSRHVWRGTQLGDAPAIEPSATFTAGKFGFNFWASRTTNNSYSEIDLIPFWQFKSFAITLYNYYNPIPGERNQFFEFGRGRSRHSLELSLDNYNVEKEKFKWMISTFIAGDRNEETQNAYFSTYLELKYPFPILSFEITPFVGMTPFEGYYAESLAIINSGIALAKSVEISKRLSVPLNLTYTWNPYFDRQMVTFSTGLVFCD